MGCRFAKRFAAAAVGLLVLLTACLPSVAPRDVASTTANPMPADDETSTAPTAEQQVTRVVYGDAPEQFGELHLPEPGEGPLPVVVLVHGGFWRNPYDLTLMDPLAADLVRRGLAVWNIEYRRVGDDGGGWPGTLTDVADAVDALAAIAGDHQIDLERVAIVGHSAGGHLALWAAGRAQLPPDVPGAAPAVVPSIAVGQGAVVDLLGAAAQPLGNGAVMELLGGTPDEVPDRYETARPRLDAGPKMVSVVGTNDDIVPPQFSIDPTRPGAIDVVEVAGAGHMDLIDPDHDAWGAVIVALQHL